MGCGGGYIKDMWDTQDAGYLTLWGTLSKNPVISADLLDSCHSLNSSSRQEVASQIAQTGCPVHSG
jgi:hypothetical protein